MLFSFLIYLLIGCICSYFMAKMADYIEREQRPEVIWLIVLAWPLYIGCAIHILITGAHKDL